MISYISDIPGMIHYFISLKIVQFEVVEQISYAGRSDKDLKSQIHSTKKGSAWL